MKLVTSAITSGTYRFSCYLTPMLQASSPTLYKPRRLIRQMENLLQEREEDIATNGENETSVHDLLTGRIVVCFVIVMIPIVIFCRPFIVVSPFCFSFS